MLLVVLQQGLNNRGRSQGKTALRSRSIKRPLTGRLLSISLRDQIIIDAVAVGCQREQPKKFGLRICQGGCGLIFAIIE